MVWSKTLYAEFWHGYDGSFTSQTRLNFLELPLYMGFQGANNFFFEMGMNVYYLIRARETIDFSGDLENIDHENLIHDFSRFNISFGSAFGFETSIAEKLKLSYSGEFQIGFSDITKQSRTNGIFQSNIPNSFFNVMAHDGFEDIPQVTTYKTSSAIYLGVRVALLVAY